MGKNSSSGFLALSCISVIYIVRTAELVVPMIRPTVGLKQIKSGASLWAMIEKRILLQTDEAEGHLRNSSVGGGMLF